MNISAGAMVLVLGLSTLASSGRLPTGDRLDVISTYAGTWKTHIVHVKTLYSRPRTENSLLQNDCWRSGGFYACNQVVGGESKALIVFTYDAKRDVYHSRIITVDGSSPPAGTLEITGNRWVYPWQDKDGVKIVYIRIVNTFVDRNTIEFRQEFSYDRVNWTVTARGVEHRVSG